MLWSIFRINQRGIIYRTDSRLKVENVTIYVDARKLVTGVDLYLHPSVDKPDENVVDPISVALSSTKSHT